MYGHSMPDGSLPFQENHTASPVDCSGGTVSKPYSSQKVFSSVTFRDGSVRVRWLLHAGWRPMMVNKKLNHGEKPWQMIANDG